MDLTADLISYICNPGLISGGARTLTGVSDTSTEADLCKAMYETVRDSELRSKIWNCTKKRIALDVDGTTPNHQWDYRYEMPEDCLYIVELEDDKDFTIEGRWILTNESNSDDQINILYVQKADVNFTAWLTSTSYSVGDYVINDSTNYVCLVAHTSGTFATDLAADYWETTDIEDIDTEIARFDSNLRNVLGKRLFAEISKHLTEKRTEQEQAWGIYDKAIDEAVLANAFEDRHDRDNRTETESTWISSRRG